MNTISVKLKSIHNSSGITKYITVEIDGIDFLKSSNDLKESIVYSQALYESAKTPGKHLIFTCECGIADCGGWDYVDVRHTNNTISWNFSYDQNYSFTFEKASYVEEINSFMVNLQKNHQDYLQQEIVTEPES